MEQGHLPPDAFRSTAHAVNLATIERAAPLETASARVMKCLFEMDTMKSRCSIPHALRAPIPAIFSFTVMELTDTGVGSFRVVLEQILSRYGFRSRAYTVRAFVNTGPAQEALAERWGFNPQIAQINFQRYYDDTVAEVRQEGALVSRIRSGRFMPGIDLSQVELPPSFNPIVLNDSDRLALSQFEPEFLALHATRGVPALEWELPPAGFSQRDILDPAVSLMFPGEMRFPRVRYLVDPFEHPDTAKPLMVLPDD